MSVQICSLEPQRHTAWDAFVQDHPHGSPFHTIAWKKTIEEIFPYQAHYLVALSGDVIVGALPLFLVKNLILGRVLMSTPFAVYGGVLADSDEVRAAMAEAVRALGSTLKADRVELRNSYPEQCLGFSPVARYVTYTGPVGPDEEAVLTSIPRKTRRIVRKSLEQPFTVRVQTEDFSAFEHLYSSNLRRLGTPAFPPKYFAALLRNFKNSADIREILLEGKPVAAALSFYFRDQVLPYYGASDERYNREAPSTFMYYDLMRWGGQNGFAMFDFGRSKVESASGHFKSHWGLVERTLPYEMLLLKGQLAAPNHSPTNPIYQWPIKIWRSLPLPVTRAIGPQVLKFFP